MKRKMFISALFASRNIGVLLLMAAAVLLLQSTAVPQLLLYGAGLAIYLGFAVSTMSSGRFQAEFERKQKIRDIQDMNFSCLKLANEAKKTFPQDRLQRLKKVMDDKDNIVDSFFKGEHSYLKEKILERTLKLVVSYIRLTDNYIVRSRELGAFNTGEVSARLNMNTRKLNFENDPAGADDLRKAIEVDEKLLEKTKNEGRELERIGTKLNYMESTINMFKHQVISNIESEEMLEQLENEVNEAEALENVLNERRKGREKA